MGIPCGPPRRGAGRRCGPRCARRPTGPPLRPVGPAAEGPPSRHAPQLLQVVVDLLSGQPRAGRRHDGRAGLGQGGEDPGPYRVQGHLGRGGFLDHSYVQHRSRIYPTKKIVKERRVVGGRIGGRQGRPGNPSDSGKRPGIPVAGRSPTPAVRTSHEADLMIAVIYGRGPRPQPGLFDEAPEELVASWRAERARARRGVAGSSLRLLDRRPGRVRRTKPGRPVPRCTALTLRSDPHAGRGSACEPAPGTGRQPAAAVSASRAPAWVRQSVWLGLVPAQRSPRALRELRSRAHSVSACFWT